MWRRSHRSGLEGRGVWSSIAGWCASCDRNNHKIWLQDLDEVLGTELEQVQAQVQAQAHVQSK